MEYPISETYAAIYRDARGEEQTTIHNDGQELRMTLRGVEFTGPSPGNFEPPEGELSNALDWFSFNHGTNFTELCGYQLEYQCPATIVLEQASSSTSATLKVLVSIGTPTRQGLADHEDVTLILSLNGNTYQSSGNSGWFEDELLEIQSLLPHGMGLQICITCAFSDYSPSGHGFFGDMACFRDNKERYLRTKTKDDVFNVWDTLTEYVQETYHCPEWERRRPGTGYRG